MEDKISNYEKLCNQWADRFVDMQKSELLLRLPELKLNETKDAFIIKHFDKTYFVNFQTGKITCQNAAEKPTSNASLNIYTLFGYVKEGARFKGMWVPFEKLKDASMFEAAYKKNIIEPLSATFDGKADLLEKALIKMDGKKIDYSDVGYEIKAFECIPIRILFWDGDDEFQAQANILFDMSATDFIHVESTVSIASEAYERICALAGVPKKGGF